jgi:hypothetical protein
VFSSSACATRDRGVAARDDFREAAIERDADSNCSARAYTDVAARDDFRDAAFDAEVDAGSSARAARGVAGRDDRCEPGGGVACSYSVFSDVSEPCDSDTRSVLLLGGGVGVVSAKSWLFFDVSDSVSSELFEDCFCAETWLLTYSSTPPGRRSRIESCPNSPN